MIALKACFNYLVLWAAEESLLKTNHGKMLDLRLNRFVEFKVIVAFAPLGHAARVCECRKVWLHQNTFPIFVAGSKGRISAKWKLATKAIYEGAATRAILADYIDARHNNRSILAPGLNLYSQDWSIDEYLRYGSSGMGHAAYQQYPTSTLWTAFLGFLGLKETRLTKPIWKSRKHQ